MVSVIIPVYNAQNVLGEAIESVLCQTYKDFELLLIDDGSTDKSPSICDAYARRDNRVKVFHKPNGGVSSARNIGLDQARGEFVSFVDNDDCIYPEFLETMVGNIGDFDYLLASYVEGGVETKKHGDSIKRQKIVAKTIDARSRKEVHDRARELRLMGFGAIWCTLFRKSVIDKYDIRFKEMQYEDTLFIYDYVAHCENMRKIFYEGYFCYHHADSQGHSHKYIAEMQALQALDDTFNRIMAHFAITDESLWNIFRWRLRSAVRSFLLKGYYLDTRVPMRKRLERWGEIRKCHFVCEPYKGHKGTVDAMIRFITISRLYYLLDPIIIFGMKVIEHKPY